MIQSQISSEASVPVFLLSVPRYLPGTRSDTAETDPLRSDWQRGARWMKWWLADHRDEAPVFSHYGWYHYQTSGGAESLLSALRQPEHAHKNDRFHWHL